MRMHRILANAAAEIIQSALNEGKVVDHALAKAFESHPKWGKRDRSFIAETVFEVIRWRRTLQFLVESEEVPALCAAQWVRMGFELPDWWEYPGATSDEMRTREGLLAEQPRTIRESIPDWLDALGQAELGETWDNEITALNQRTRVYLRVNTLKTSPSAAIEWLASEYHITAEAVEGLPHTLALLPGKTIPKSVRMDGRVEIQDAGSQMIAPLLKPQTGDFIIDACAGAGGKTLHLAALMQNEGRIIGMDIHPRKLQELERRAQRARASKCIETQVIAPDTIETYREAADCLLIDSPCSGLGTLKRQPDLKWRLTADQLQKVRATQAELLASYTQMLKPGGRLVYATCSVLPSENRAAVERLIAGGNFSLVEECIVSPAVTGYDGFYAAALVKA